MAGHKSIWSQPKKKPYKSPQRHDAEKNAAPSQWGRRLARRIGDKFGVQMVDNHSKNHGVFRGKAIIIKCAKSPKPSVSILESNLARTDELWAVYLMPEGHADVWVVPIADVRRHGYFTRGINTQRRVELTLRKVIISGRHFGTLHEHEVAACRIP
jgi:hypothetical protein